MNAGSEDILPETVTMPGREAVVVATGVAAAEVVADHQGLEDDPGLAPDLGLHIDAVTVAVEVVAAAEAAAGTIKTKAQHVRHERRKCLDMLEKKSLNHTIVFLCQSCSFQMFTILCNFQLMPDMFTLFRNFNRGLFTCYT